MKPEVDAIVAALPPPGKGGGAEEPEGDEYNPEEAAAMDVASALGIPAAKVDVQALCSALRDFQRVTSGPGPEEE